MSVTPPSLTRQLRQLVGGERMRRARGRLVTGGTAFLARGLQQVTSLVLTILAARFLVPAEYGVYTLSVVFVSLIQTLTYTGYFQFVVTRKGDEKVVLDTAFWLITLGAAIGSAALLLAAPWIGVLYEAPDLEVVLMLLAAIQPVSAIGAWCSAVLMRHERMRVQYNILIVQNLAALAAGVALLVAWQSVFALVAHRYVRIILGAVLYLPFTKVLPGLSLRWAVVREATSYASALYGSRTLNFFANYGADLALGLVFSTAEAGLYRFGNRLATAAVDVVAQPMRWFALAQFGAANRNDRPFEDVLARFAPTILFLTGGVAASVIVFAAPAVEVFLQPGYLAATVVAAALAVGATARFGNQLVEPVFSARGRTGVAMAYGGGVAAAQLAGVVLATPFGLAAVAVTSAAVSALGSVLAFVMFARVARIPTGRALSRSAGAAALAAGYGLTAYASWVSIRSAFGLDAASLALAVGTAVLLGLATMAAAVRLRVVRLAVFSG